MRRGIFLPAIWLMSFPAFSNQTLLECGLNTGNGFNGWSVEPYTAFTTVNFTEETISFYAENGGDYSIVLTRKVEVMKQFSTLNLTLGFSNFDNCQLNYVDVFASTDSKNWDQIDINQADYKTVFENPKGYLFIKLVANVSCSNNGYLECTYFKLSSDEELAISEVDAPAVTDDFFIFFFNRSVNIETKTEEAYDIVFTNLAGQIVYAESSVGSTRIESELPDGIYIISILQNKQVVRTKKVVFAS